MMGSNLATALHSKAENSIDKAKGFPNPEDLLLGNCLN
jgi:hypothetical protein